MSTYVEFRDAFTPRFFFWLLVRLDWWLIKATFSVPDLARFVPKLMHLNEMFPLNNYVPLTLLNLVSGVVAY